MPRGGKGIGGASEAMGVVPTEDAVQALMEHLVYPLLPAKSSFRESPSLSKQKSVAKQMSAVVLLYNYYHRKQKPSLEFLGFESFCKVAVNIRPSLLAYLKFMQRLGSNDESGNINEQLSITEEMIMSACNICAELDASKDAPSMDKWPVVKVAVFLVDLTKMNCFLQFCSKTQGVWSLIEKDLDTPYYTKEVASDMKFRNEKKKYAENHSRNELVAGEAALRQLAFSIVKDETGIVQSDLAILESHTAYSLGKANSTARLYVMQCTKALDEEVMQVSIKDAVGSLSGPLFIKKVDRYEVTPAVEYFHLLPYARILSEWFPGKNSIDSPENVVGSSPKRSRSCIEGDESGDGFDSSWKTRKAQDFGTCCGNESANEEENADYRISGSSEAAFSPQVTVTDSLFDHSVELCISRDATNIVQHITNTKNKESLSHKISLDTENNVQDKVETASVEKASNADNTDGKQMPENGVFMFQNDKSGHRPPVSSVVSENLDKVHVVLASKGNDLLNSAIRTLKRKRDELSHRHRQLEDEIAICERSIQAVIARDEDDLLLKIESIIDAFNTACPEGSGRSESGERLPQYCKRRRLSEAILILRSPCQELDDICAANNWILPRYNVLPSNGRYLANITVQGLDFEFSDGGEFQNNPWEARESAASKMLSKLRDMVKLSN